MAQLDEYGERIPYGLNRKQYKFGVELVETMRCGRENKSKAARAAGYKGSAESLRTTGSRLAQHDGVKRLVAELHRKMVEGDELGDLTASEVIGNLRDIATKGKSEQARVAASVALGRTLALFTDVLETKETRPIQEQLTAMTSPDIRGLAATLIAELDKRGEPYDNIISMEAVSG